MANSTIVSNPYSFNIKSNQVFSTNALISDNQVKMTMVYFPSTEDDPVETLIYSKDLSACELIPNIINGVEITKLGLQLSSSGNFYCSILADGKRYSKIILNGGPFYNFEVNYNQLLTNTTSVYVYSGDIIGTDPTYWGYFDKSSFDLTIKFV